MINMRKNMMMAVIAGAVLVGASSVCANASSMKNETLSSVNSDVENVEITIPGDEGEEVNVDGSGDMQIIKTEDGYGVSVKLINSTADNVTKNKKVVKIVSAKAGDNLVLNKMNSTSDDEEVYVICETSPYILGNNVCEITQEFSNSKHQGVDLAAKEGTPVYSTYSGKVSAVGNDEERGNYIEITMYSGKTTIFNHLKEKPDVNVGDQIPCGVQIGEIGKTGNSETPHLHYAVKDKDGKYLNPGLYMQIFTE